MISIKISYDRLNADHRIFWMATELVEFIQETMKNGSPADILLGLYDVLGYVAKDLVPEDRFVHLVQELCDYGLAIELYDAQRPDRRTFISHDDFQRGVQAFFSCVRILHESDDFLSERFLSKPVFGRWNAKNGSKGRDVIPFTRMIGTAMCVDHSWMQSKSLQFKGVVASAIYRRYRDLLSNLTDSESLEGE